LCVYKYWSENINRENQGLLWKQNWNSQSTCIHFSSKCLLQWLWATSKYCDNQI
jgi:hypothetical protein